MIRRNRRFREILKRKKGEATTRPQNPRTQLLRNCLFFGLFFQKTIVENRNNLKPKTI
jgi:hypothetical protein